MGRRRGEPTHGCIQAAYVRLCTRQRIPYCALDTAYSAVHWTLLYCAMYNAYSTVHCTAHTLLRTVQSFLCCALYSAYSTVYGPLHLGHQKELLQALELEVLIVHQVKPGNNTPQAHPTAWRRREAYGRNHESSVQLGWR